MALLTTTSVVNSKTKIRIDDMKKSSFYVWFLGAKESGGLRGVEYVKPAVKYFIGKEKGVEPIKVTLQVNSKGLKIIQQSNIVAAFVPTKNKNNKIDNKTDTIEPIKHLIPQHAITCVVQEEAPNDDIVSCILLIYNPATKCPVHVHSYRCDSVETATFLKTQLQTLIERPENQRKFNDIENRIKAKGLLPGLQDRRSEGRGSTSSTRESSDSCSSSEGRNNQDKIATLYDSLAAELREKLGSGKKVQTPGPILLPPRDYDTVHRKHGNLRGIDKRRSLNAAIVGMVGATPKTVRSGGGEDSSGIGSDDAPSADTPPAYEPIRENDRQSSSDEEWLENSHPQAKTAQDLILVQPVWEKRHPTEKISAEEVSTPSRRRSKEVEEMATPNRRRSKEVEELATPNRRRSKEVEELATPNRRRVKEVEELAIPNRRRKDADERQLKPLNNKLNNSKDGVSPRDRFQDAREKFKMLERSQKLEVEVPTQVLNSSNKGRIKVTRTPSTGRDAYAQDSHNGKNANFHRQSSHDSIDRRYSPSKVRNGKASYEPVRKEDTVDDYPVKTRIPKYKSQRSFENTTSPVNRREYLRHQSCENLIESFAPRSRQSMVENLTHNDRFQRLSPPHEHAKIIPRHVANSSYWQRPMISSKSQDNLHFDCDDYSDNECNENVRNNRGSPRHRNNNRHNDYYDDDHGSQHRSLVNVGEEYFVPRIRSSPQDRMLPNKYRHEEDCPEDSHGRRRTVSEIAREFRRRQVDYDNRPVLRRELSHGDIIDGHKIHPKPVRYENDIAKRTPIGRESSLSSHTTGTQSSRTSESYQELADHERFPGLDREPIRMNYAKQNSRFLAPQDHRKNFRHSFASADYPINGTPPMPIHRVGIAAMPRY